MGTFEKMVPTRQGRALQCAYPFQNLGRYCHQKHQLDVPIPPWSSSDTRAEHGEAMSLQLNIYQHRECKAPDLTRFLHHDPSHQFVFVPLVDMDCRVDTPFWMSSANLGAPPW